MQRGRYNSGAVFVVSVVVVVSLEFIFFSDGSSEIR